MPGKLKILLGMYGVNLILGIVQAVTADGSWVGVGITALIAGLLFKGNNVVRIIVIVFAVIGLIFGALGLLGLGAILALGAGEAIIPLISVVWSLIVNIFALFALTRPDVKAHFAPQDAGAAPPAAG